jgi:hypothetical protein
MSLASVKTPYYGPPGTLTYVQMQSPMYECAQLHRMQSPVGCDLILTRTTLAQYCSVEYEQSDNASLIHYSFKRSLLCQTAIVSNYFDGNLA